MRIKADLYSGRLFEYWEPKKRDHLGTRPVPADGFYEWKKVVGGKIPYSIGMKDDSPFVLAGLWEGWKDPATDEWLRACTIITGGPNDFVRTIHTRMPVIPPKEHHDAWLSGRL